MTTDGEQGTKRFRPKRDAILAAAAEAINEQSAKGMTFADVARRVGLNTTSVTYYFKRKEDLAAAAFEHTLDTLMAMLDEAMEEADAAGARRALSCDSTWSGSPRIERGEERAFAVLSDLRAMEEPDPQPADERAGARCSARTRALWGAGAAARETDLHGARAHVLLENTFWLPAWLTRYELDAICPRRGAADGRVRARHRGARRQTGRRRCSTSTMTRPSPAARRSCSRRRA